jgi:predicted DNA-binding protein
MSKTAIVQTRMTPEARARLERLALDDSRTLSDYVRLVLERHLKSVECLEALASDEMFVQRADGELSTKAASTERSVWLEK